CVDGNEIKVIEIAARIGGKLSYKIIKQQVGIDIIDTFVNGVLGIKSDLMVSLSNKKMLTYIIHSKDGIFNGFEGHQNFIDDKTIEDFVVYRTNGMKVEGSLSARSRIGAISFTGNDIDEVINKYEIVLKNIKAKDENEEDMINR